jgi:hypothetical protein
MNTMIKKFAAIVCLSLPLLGTAATDKAEGKAANPAASAPKAKAPAARKPASPQAPQAPTRTNKEEQVRVQSRGALMGACQKKAGDQQLSGVERKLFLGNCMNGK